MNNRTIRTIVIVLVVLCVAYPACAWLIGLRVEAVTAKNEQVALDRYPGAVRITSRQYHRGLFTSTEDTTVAFGAATLRALAPLAGVLDPASFHVTVHNVIHHGPLPQFRSVAMASIDTLIELPPDLATKLRALIGGSPDIQVQSRLNWLGGSTARLTSTAYQGQLANGAHVSWHGIDTTGHSNADLTSNSVSAHVTDFGLQTSSVTTELDGLQLTAQWKPAFEVLTSGPFDFRIATLKWQSMPASEPVIVQGLAANGSSAVDGDYYASSMQFGADSVQGPHFAVTHALYALSVEHLYGPAVAALVKSTQAGVNAGDTPQETAAARVNAMKQQGIELLIHDPVLKVPHVDFTMPEGTLQLSAAGSIPGLQRADLDGPQAQAALLQHLKVTADLRIDTALLNRLLNDSGRKDAMSGQIDALEQQGYIKHDGATLTAHVVYDAGKITVNGLPYPPRR